VCLQSQSGGGVQRQPCQAVAVPADGQEPRPAPDGLHVMTAVNIQHIDTLNDAAARMTGVRVRETVPDRFIDRTDDVINVDVTTEELRNCRRTDRVHETRRRHARGVRATPTFALADARARICHRPVSDRGSGRHRTRGACQRLTQRVDEVWRKPDARARVGRATSAWLRCASASFSTHPSWPPTPRRSR
jgi:hypothetical protein